MLQRFLSTIQDYDLGLVIGESSYGKGSVQQIFPISKGGVKITTSHYYLKSGRCIQKNYVNDDSTDYYTLQGREVESGNGIKPDLTVSQEELSTVTGNLLDKNIFFVFAVDFFQEHSHEITKDFLVTDDIFKEFKMFSRHYVEDISNDELNRNRESLSYLLKTDLLGLRFGDETRYRELLTRDMQLLKALDIINKSDSKKDIFAMIEQEYK